MLQGFGNARRASAGDKKDANHWFDGQQKYSGRTTPDFRDQYRKSRTDMPSMANPTQAAQTPGKQVTSWLQNQNVYSPESVNTRSRMNTFQRMQAYLESRKEEEPQ